MGKKFLRALTALVPISVLAMVLTWQKGEPQLFSIFLIILLTTFVTWAWKHQQEYLSMFDD